MSALTAIRNRPLRFHSIVQHHLSTGYLSALRCSGQACILTRNLLGAVDYGKFLGNYGGNHGGIASGHGFLPKFIGRNSDPGQ
jgi:hypothetical protein